MKNNRTWLLLILLFLAMAVMPCFDAYTAGYQGVEAAQPEMESPESDNLDFETKASDEGMVEILIYLKKQVDTAAVALKVKENRTLSGGLTPDLRTEVRRAVVDALQKNAENSQDTLLRYLEDQKNAGRVDEVRSYFIVNLVYARVSKELIDEIAARPEVKSIEPNERVYLVEPVKGVALPQIKNVEWNINRIRAPFVWSAGIDGSGVVVGIIDTGVDWQHEALKEQYRGYDPLNPESPSHAYNWFDPYHEMSFPDDWHGHGSHVAGTILGADPAGNNRIGVAPGAKWIAARGLNNAGSGTANDLLAAGQYLLAPTPNPDGSGTPDPSKAPDIINNSWGSRTGQLNEWYREMVQNWQAAGILPVFAAGNSGPKSGTLLVPANYPESFAVAATNSQDNLARFSSRGPSPYPAPDDMQPDISAPGVNIRSVQSYSPDRARGYSTKSGTSMAAPHISGVAALLIQSDPSLTVDELEVIMLDTAWPRTDDTYFDVPNYGYGYGLVDALNAVATDPPSLLSASFDSGTWYYSGFFESWFRFSTSTALAMTHADMTGDGELNFVGSYPSGIWYREGFNLVKIAGSTATALAGYPEGWMAASFASGTWLYDAWVEEWFKLTPSTAHALTWIAKPDAPGGLTLVASFNSGTWFYKPIPHRAIEDLRVQIPEEGFAQMFYWERLSTSTARALEGNGENLYASFNSGTWLYYPVEDEADDLNDGPEYQWYRLTPSTAHAITFAEMPYEGENGDAGDGGVAETPVFSFPSGTWYWVPPGDEGLGTANGVLDFTAEDEPWLEWKRLSTSTARSLSGMQSWWHPSSN